MARLGFNTLFQEVVVLTVLLHYWDKSIPKPGG